MYAKRQLPERQVQRMKDRKNKVFRILFALGLGCLTALLFGCGKGTLGSEGLFWHKDEILSEESETELSSEEMQMLCSASETEEMQIQILRSASETEEESGRRSGMILIHICGAVERSGVYEIPEDGRIVDAVNAAGGFSPEAAPDYINMAQKLCDGSKIIIPTMDEVAESPYGTSVLVTEPGAAESPDPGDRKVNINTADAEELTSLPGVGRTRAEAIVRYRSREGAFTCAEDLTKVPGIGESIFRNLRDQVCIE